MEFNEQLDLDDTIFHYTTMSVLLTHIGWTKKLKLGKRRDSRNPDEYKKWNYTAVGWESNTVSDEQVTKAFFDVNRTINDIVQNDFDVACFTIHELSSETKDQPVYIKRRGYMRPRMWSQYGNDHMGVCLAISKKLLLDSVRTQYPSIKVFANQVKYLNDEEIIRRMRPMDAIKMATDSEYSTQFIFNNIEEIFFMEDEDFRDESEFRIVLHNKNCENFYLNINEFLLGILVGDRVPKGLNENLKKVADLLGFNIKRLWWENGMYFRVDI